MSLSTMHPAYRPDFSNKPPYREITAGGQIVEGREMRPTAEVLIKEIYQKISMLSDEDRTRVKTRIAEIGRLKKDGNLDEDGVLRAYEELNLTIGPENLKNRGTTASPEKKEGNITSDETTLSPETIETLKTKRFRMVNQEVDEIINSALLDNETKLQFLLDGIKNLFNIPYPSEDEPSNEYKKEVVSKINEILQRQVNTETDSTEQLNEIKKIIMADPRINDEEIIELTDEVK